MVRIFADTRHDVPASSWYALSPVGCRDARTDRDVTSPGSIDVTVSEPVVTAAGTESLGLESPHIQSDERPQRVRVWLRQYEQCLDVSDISAAQVGLRTAKYVAWLHSNVYFLFLLTLRQHHAIVIVKAQMLIFR